MRREVRYPGQQNHNGGLSLGEDNGRSQMTNAEVRAARELRFTMDMTVGELALMYRVSKGAMSYLLQRRDVTGQLAVPISAPDPRGNNRRRATLEA